MLVLILVFAMTYLACGIFSDGIYYIIDPKVTKKQANRMLIKLILVASTLGTAWGWVLNHVLLPLFDKLLGNVV